MWEFKELVYKILKSLIKFSDQNKASNPKIISSQQVFPGNFNIPKTAFPDEVHKTLKTLKRRRRSWRRGKRRTAKRNQFRQNRKIGTLFKKNHGQDLVFLYFTDFEVVDIQKKIKDLLILVRMEPVDQEQIFKKEILKAKINIDIKIKKYNLDSGQLEYEFKKTKKENFSNKIDCNPNEFLIRSFFPRNDDHRHGHHHQRIHSAHALESTRNWVCKD